MGNRAPCASQNEHCCLQSKAYGFVPLSIAKFSL
jgi:hypothetical protein